MMTIEQMVTRDQRDVAVDALNDIVSRIKGMRTKNVLEMSVEEIVDLLNGTLCVVDFIAHSTVDRVDRMNEQI